MTGEPYLFARIALAIILTFISFSSARAEGDVKNSVVKIYTINNRYNYHEPWQMHGQNSFQGSGAIVAGNKILTNAHVVSDQTFLQVRRAGKAKKYTAQIEMIAHESDLAILTVADDAFFSDVTPLAIGTLAKVRDDVSVYGFPEGGDKLSITEGVVSRVEHSNYTHSGAYLLACQIDAPVNSGNSGGPVIKDEKVIGIAFQGLQGGRYENIGYMVPAPVIKHFLEDIKDGIYDGTPDMGITMQKMENPDIRHNYFMNEIQTGVLINKIYPDSPVAGILKSGDVILSIDGENVANDGTIEFRKGERTFFGYVLQRKQLGDSVRLDIMRKGEKVNVEIILSRPIDFERLVPQRKYDTPPTYYIAGGLVFEPLRLNYLMEFGSGSDWYLNAPTDLLNNYINGEPEPDKRDLVILIKVLADETNVGYHDSENVIVSFVNGIKISTIQDLVSAFEDHKGTYHVIEDVKGYKIVLSRKSVDESSERILKKYKIASDRSEDLIVH